MRDLRKGTEVYTAFHNHSVDTEPAGRWYSPLIRRRMLDAFTERPDALGKWWKLPDLVYAKAQAPG
jgi:hypothetical protein